MFWFGRYAERAEDLLRLVLAAHGLAEDFRTRPRSAGGASLSRDDGRDRPCWRRRRRDDLDAELRSLLLDAERAGSVAHALAALRDALQGVRDQLSGRTPGARSAPPTGPRDALVAAHHSHQVAESAGRMLTGILSLQGVTASMIRDPGWHMIGAGRASSAASSCPPAARHHHRAPRHRRRPRGPQRRAGSPPRARSPTGAATAATCGPPGVLDLLLMDPDNPRSLAFCLAELRTPPGGAARLHRLHPPRAAARRPASPASSATDVATLVAIGGVERPNLERFLDDAPRRS